MLFKIALAREHCSCVVSAKTEVYDIHFILRRVHGNLEESQHQRLELDRRRLEEGFIIFASIDVVNKFKILIDYYPSDKTKLTEKLVDPLHQAFITKWGST